MKNVCKNIDLLKKHNYTDDDIALYIDAMFDIMTENISTDPFCQHIKSNYPGLTEALEDTEMLNRTAIHHLAGIITK